MRRECRVRFYGTEKEVQKREEGHKEYYRNFKNLRMRKLGRLTLRRNGATARKLESAGLPLEVTPATLATYSSILRVGFTVRIALQVQQLVGSLACTHGRDERATNEITWIELRPSDI